MKQTGLDAKTFGKLLESVREGGAILRGQRKPSRSFVAGASGVRAIRERTSLSQSEFATRIGVRVKTLQNWEQDRRRPTGPAETLLRIIADRWAWWDDAKSLQIGALRSGAGWRPC
jgi:putative transcriptional regulator